MVVEFADSAYVVKRFRHDSRDAEPTRVLDTKNLVVFWGGYVKNVPILLTNQGVAYAQVFYRDFMETKRFESSQDIPISGIDKFRYYVWVISDRMRGIDDLSIDIHRASSPNTGFYWMDRLPSELRSLTPFQLIQKCLPSDEVREILIENQKLNSRGDQDFLWTQKDCYLKLRLFQCYEKGNEFSPFIALPHTLIRVTDLDSFSDKVAPWVSAFFENNLPAAVQLTGKGRFDIGEAVKQVATQDVEVFATIINKLSSRWLVLDTEHPDFTDRLLSLASVNKDS
jgi:hypothetical protein